MPQMGIPFIPGISLFDLVDQSATLEVQIQSNDESLSTQADITIVP